MDHLRQRILDGFVALVHFAAALVAFGLPLLAIGRSIFGSDHGDPPDVGLARWPSLLRNTLIVSLVAVGLSTIGGALAAILTARTSWVCRKPLFGVLSLVACFPPFVVATTIFAETPPYAMPSSPWMCGLLMAVAWLSPAFLLIHAALSRVDAELEDAALLDCTRGGVFRHVTLPLAWPAIVSTALLIAVLSATDCAIPDLLQVRTFAEETYTQFQLRRAPAGPLLTGLPLLLVLSSLLLLAQRRWQDWQPVASYEAGRARHGFQPGAAAQAAMAIGLVAVAVLAARFPFALLRRIESPAGFFDSLAGVWPELRRSLVYCGFAATLMAVLGIGLAQIAVRTRFGRLLGGPLVALAIATPAPAAGVALIAAFNRPGPLGAIYDSPAILIVAYLARFFPIAVLLLMPAAARVPRELDDAARIDGGGWTQRLLHVYGPMVREHAVACGLIVFLLCFAEIICTHLVSPPGTLVASVRAFSLLHFGVYRDWATLAFAGAAIAALMWLTLRWRLRAARQI
ncbi:MAG: iron ABC transporter permease [Planctomycetes bacterium]|nr:iron ABC transporter permease [Planctomycetota bacterium]